MAASGLGRILSSIGKNLLMVLFGLVFALVLMEIVLRIYNPFEFRLRGDHIVLQTNTKHVIENTLAPKLDPEIVQVRNSLGFRGAEPPQPLDQRGTIPLVYKKYLTIIAIGGSTTECFYLTEGKTWEDRLSGLLRQQFDKVWVNNAGLGGHSSFGHLVLLRDDVVALQPDVALFLLGFNDVSREGPSSNADQKLMEGGKFRADNPAAADEAASGTGWCFSSLRCFGSSLAYHSEAVNLGLNLYRNYKADQAAAGQLGQVTVRSVARGVAQDVQVDLTKLEHVTISEAEIKQAMQDHRQKFLPGYEQRVAALVEISRTNGIEPVLMTQPALYGDAVDDITGVDLGTIRLEDGSNGIMTWRILELYNDVVRKVAAEQGVLLIDLAAKMPKSSLYYYDLGHYTNEGAEKVAQLIAQDLVPYLLQKNLAERKSQ